jgi:hypothetical protein
MSNTKATLLFNEREKRPPDGFVHLKVWHLSKPLLGSRHPYKYSLSYVIAGNCVLRYDNERGKGDHRHFTNVETPYEFSSVGQLLRDFRADVETWNRWRSR